MGPGTTTDLYLAEGETFASRRQELTDQLMTRLHDDHRPLSPAARTELINQVIVINTPVAHRIARKFQGRGCPVEDLEQTACLALVRAVQQFEPSTGHHFLSYVVPCISGEIKRHFRDLGWMVRPPRPVQELQSLVAREQLRVDPHNGASPNAVEIAHRLHVSVEAVRQALQARGCFFPTSLDSVVAGTDQLLLDVLPDPLADGEYGAAEARAILAPALARLGRADRELIQMRFVDGRAQREIGKELGISQSQVSRLLTQALRRLRCLVDEPALARAEPAA